MPVVACDGGWVVDVRGICVVIGRQVGRAAFVALTLAIGGSLAGCGSLIADLPVVGLPADAPKRPNEPRAFLPVHDVPDSRDGINNKMTNAEQQQIQADLVAARARSAAAAK